uniref:NADH dehydrogenase subunit 2 n=1 Tax=Pissodes yunnanensis TaxID=1723750 RepID=UPI00207B0076|nr:NADH dehydrogenase subunit 2 [Pissodes yunnanensis]URP30496.1 NADH dehydrogenase subunit 2 [Pissodes yunnanensis]
MKNFYKMLFLNTMIIGTLISISSTSWLTSWIGLEINLLSMMPLMKNIKNKFSSEATIKYFIVQTMASSMLLFSIIIFANIKNFSYHLSTIPSIFTDLALLMKMGAAPLHFWLPEVISGMNWSMGYILLTWQKIAPMILLTYSSMIPLFLSIFIVSSSLISGLQNMNQTCLRKILAYSSINHVSWMISAMMNSFMIWFYYFIIYCLINSNIVLLLNKYNIYFINQLSKFLTWNKNMKFMFMMNFLSLGGLPPFIGFLPKWLVINFMIKNNFYSLAILLIIFTLMSLYTYLRITFSSLILNSEESLVNKNYNNNYTQFMSNFISLSGLMMCTIMVNYL